MLKALCTLTDPPALRSVNHWARCLVLGICHKCLRVLGVPHFTATFLNPGVAKIIDINNFLPWDKQWFMDGLNEVDYRTTHKCIKNDSNSYQPTWVSAGSSIRNEIEKFIAGRIPNEPQPQVQPEIQPVIGGGDDSFDDDFGPDFNAIQNVDSGANVGGAGSKIDRVKRALQSYERHSKGYVPIHEF